MSLAVLGDTTAPAQSVQFLYFANLCNLAFHFLVLFPVRFGPDASWEENVAMALKLLGEAPVLDG